MRLHVRLALPLFAIALAVTVAGTAGVIALVRLTIGFALDSQGRQLAAITEGLLRGRCAGLAQQAAALGGAAGFKERANTKRAEARLDLAGSRGVDGHFALAYGGGLHRADLNGLLDRARAAWSWTVAGSATESVASEPSPIAGAETGVLLVRAGDRLMVAGLTPGPTPGEFTVVGQRLGRAFAAALADLLQTEVSFSSGGRTVATTLPDPAPADLAPVFFTISTTGNAAVTFTYHLHAAETARVRRFALAATVGGGAGLLVLAMLFYGWTVFRVTGPIRDLSRAAERIAAGHLEERLPHEAPAELGTLVRQFNAMAAALRQAQEKLVHSAKLSSVGQMVAGISHELNNPLWGLIGHAEFLATVITPGAPGRPELDIVLAEANRMKRALADLRGFVKPGSGDRMRLDLNAVVGEVLALVRHDADKAGVTIIPTLAPGGAPVVADPDGIRQVALNFALNALQAMRTGGTLAVRTETTGSDGAAMSRLVVEDSGHGLAAEAKDRVAEPFFTTKPGHLGLGLAISRDVAQLHGGTVRLENREAGGARAVLELPAAPAEVRA